MSSLAVVSSMVLFCTDPSDAAHELLTGWKLYFKGGCVNEDEGNRVGNPSGPNCDERNDNAFLQLELIAIYTK